MRLPTRSGGMMGFSFHDRHEDFLRIADGYDWELLFRSAGLST